MPLITDAKDERLVNPRPLMSASHILCFDSLIAVLKERDQLRELCMPDMPRLRQTMFTIVHERDSLRAERDAAIGAKEKAEAQLCRAREALESFKNSSTDAGDYRSINELDAALSSSSPCPHELAEKRLRRELSVAVASAKAMVSNEMVARLEIIYKEEVVGCTEHEMAILARFMEDFRSLARENREALDDILRRRAGGPA